MALTNQLFTADKQASFITGNQDKNGLLECMSVFTFAKTEKCSPTLLLTCKTNKKKEEAHAHETRKAHRNT